MMQLQAGICHRRNGVRGSCTAAILKLLTSALGQKRTWRGEFSMSALPPKADIIRYGGNVRFVPKADIAALFDYFVGAPGQGQRDCNTERPGGL